MKAKLLIIEDDHGVRESLSLALNLEDYLVIEAENGEIGLEKLNENPDLVLLDVLMPGEDGFRILTKIKNKTNIPVLMLTALDEVEWRVKGLRSGADDYLIKPYSFAELLARIEVLLRRHHKSANENGFSYFDLRIILDKMQAWRGDQVLNLHPKTFLLLKTFIEHSEQILPKEALMQAVWGEEIEPNTLEVHLSSLRKALGEPSLIHTVRGYGYVLRVSSQALEKK